jgi:hypothetical protein
MTEELRHGDLRQTFVGGPTELLERLCHMRANWIIEPESIVPDETGNAEGGDRLRQAPDGNTLIDAAPAVAVSKDQAVMARDRDTGARDGMCRHPVPHSGIESLCRSR